MSLIHATGIFFDGKGVLLKGPSGSGKSDLALRLMSLGAELIGDDYVDVSHNEQGRLIMTAPANIAGMIEVRNVGLVTVPYREVAEIDLLLCLVDKVQRLERLPTPKNISLEDGDIPGLDFYAFEISAPEKLRAALKLLAQK